MKQEAESLSTNVYCHSASSSVLYDHLYAVNSEAELGWDARFEILTALKIQVEVFWFVMLPSSGCDAVQRYGRIPSFRKTIRLFTVLNKHVVQRIIHQ
jgi:hypothetical protein